jgi:hypothetical protein
MWCMSMLTIAALHINFGGDMAAPNGTLLAAVCVVPPLFMLLVWRRAAVPFPTIDAIPSLQADTACSN